jgi:hypothetical protein
MTGSSLLINPAMQNRKDCNALTYFWTRHQTHTKLPPHLANRSSGPSSSPNYYRPIRKPTGPFCLCSTFIPFRLQHRLCRTKITALHLYGCSDQCHPSLQMTHRTSPRPSGSGVQQRGQTEVSAIKWTACCERVLAPTTPWHNASAFACCSKVKYSPWYHKQPTKRPTTSSSVKTSAEFQISRQQRRPITYLSLAAHDLPFDELLLLSTQIPHRLVPYRALRSQPP